jgi:positive regulator of sigma E activity
MIREGRVLECVGDMVRVEFVRPADCGKCNACNGKQCRILLHGQANPGDRVEVEMPDTHMIKVSAMAYVVPLSMLLLGMLVFWTLHGLLDIGMEKELFSALGGGVFLLVALGILHLLDKRLRFRQQWQPRIVAIHPGKEE